MDKSHRHREGAQDSTRIVKASSPESPLTALPESPYEIHGEEFRLGIERNLEQNKVTVNTRL